MERYDNNHTISGSWVADEDRTLILAFDNRYSKLRCLEFAADQLDSFFFDALLHRCGSFPPHSVPTM